jgi:hypothetical protein
VIVVEQAAKGTACVNQFLFSPMPPAVGYVDIAEDGDHEVVHRYFGVRIAD